MAADQARDGRYIDDRAAASGLHRGALHRPDGVLAAQESAVGIDRHDTFPIVQGAVLDRAHGADAG